ncbi:DUF2141 domain-containing protein [Sphingomonas canadensis]|uniref:DUF2141 domain-containing protein n=1 Tax=Sphingomonas canadensis TaxID=1219257 RepID=A0ABW3HAU2_9SPHN|nr:DUF2141 domain-containing protein [Sphingomonas canadensis]MCW3837197.1 DUF2141 domain-containing protein [Sphingomonas canadensis]
MKRRILGIAAAAALVAPAGAHAPAQTVDAPCNGTGVPIHVIALDMKDRTGSIKVELWPANEQDFLKDDRDLKREGKFFARVWGKVPASGPVTLCIRVPQAGRYGMVFTHDRDGKNKFNIWKDGVGVVSNRAVGRSRPKLAYSTINVAPGGVQVTLKMQYLRGLSGFSPAR